MKTSRNFSESGISILAVSLFFPGLFLTMLSAEEFREFTNSSGKTIKASVIAATATDVTLKMEDGRQMTGGVSFFSESDRVFIEGWRKANPAKIAYDFNIAKTAKAAAMQAGSLNEGMVPSGALLIKTSSAKLGDVEYLRSVEIETDAVPITLSELAPGWYYADGSKDKNDDELEGIWIQIAEGDTVVFEKKLGSKAAADAKWVAPSGGSARAN